MVFPVYNFSPKVLKDRNLKFSRMVESLQPQCVSPEENKNILFSFFLLFFDRDTFITSEYKICFKIVQCIVDILVSKATKKDSAQLSRWSGGNCVQLTCVQSPSAEYFFFLNCVKIDEFIFELIYFTYIHLNSFKSHNKNDF